MFWIGRKKKLIQSTLFEGLTDYHSHLLPGVDDGVRTAEESLQMLIAYENLGVKKIVFTPHIMEDLPNNNREQLSSNFKEFIKKYSGRMELSLGGEYMLDSGFDKHLQRGDLLTIENNRILVETSYMYAPINFYSTLEYIKSKGYQIVLAHPERYAYMKQADYDRLKQMQVDFQLNLLSICGFYGRQVQNTTNELLDLQYYNCIGSDLHNPGQFIHAISESRISGKIIQAIKELYFTS